MKLKIFQGGAGDALLIQSTSTGTTHRILVDAGEPKSYDINIAATMGLMRKRKEPLDVVYVSHIDRDHIGGVLRMLDSEAAWRIHEHLAADVPSRPQPQTPRPPEIREIWHNAFFEDAAMNTPDIVNTLAGSGSVLFGHSAETLRVIGTDLSDLASSVGDAIEVSRRIGNNQLGIPLNKPSSGQFLTLRPGITVPDIGPIKTTILGPTPANLRGLIADWNTWLEEKAKFLQGLIEDHEAEEELLASNDAQAGFRIAEAQANSIAASSGRVTPPNVASLMVMMEEAGKRIILSGDGAAPDLITGLETQGILPPNGSLHVDVLKVPHHGADNSYSDELARRVTADHYVFCGNGDHGNPEPRVVEAYIRSRRDLAGGANPQPAHLRPTKLWFNHSADEATEEEAEREQQGKTPDVARIDRWRTLEARVGELQSENLRPRLKTRFLRGARSMTFTL